MRIKYIKCYNTSCKIKVAHVRVPFYLMNCLLTRESVLLIGTQFIKLYTTVDTPSFSNIFTLLGSRYASVSKET
jgi:hypothetical protein